MKILGIDITDWLMVIITGIYVVATIFICIANFKSAKATRDQTAEQQNQFKEENRALINIFFEMRNSAVAVLHIQNNGKRIAKNVKISIEEDFINNVPEGYDKQHLSKLPKSTFTLGIGQSWYCPLGGTNEMKKISEKIIKGNVSYSDELGNYNETFEIDLKQYFWAVLTTSQIEKIYSTLREQSQSMKQIEKSISGIAERLNCKAGGEENE